MKRESMVEGLKKMIEVDDSHVSYLCDVIDEIMLVDKRASRLLYPILDKLGTTAFYDPRLEEFIETHAPGEANYRMLLDWNTEIQRDAKKKNNYIMVNKNDIRTISYIINILSKSQLRNQMENSLLQKFRSPSIKLDITLNNVTIIGTGDKIKLIILDNIEYRMSRDLFFIILNILKSPREEYYLLELLF